MINPRNLAIIGYELACPGTKGRRVVLIDGRYTRQHPGESLLQHVRRMNKDREPIRGRLLIADPAPLEELINLAARLCPEPEDLCPKPSDS